MDREELTDGVWYDEVGDVKVEFAIENGQVLFLEPETEALYHEVPVDEFDPSEFKRPDDSK
jgi:hypothetical protein